MSAVATRNPICNHCKRRKAAPDKKRCRPCLDKAAANGRRRYAKLAAAAKCTHCGSRRAMPGESRCKPCGRKRSSELASLPWPRIFRSWYIETFGGYEFGPYRNELEAHGDAVFRHIEHRYGEYVVYARIELDGTPDLDDLRSPLSFEIG